MARKWGTETTIKCLKEYSKHACLWNANDANYKNKSARNSALQKIVDILQLENYNIGDLKTKIHSIRNTYVNEVTKVLKSKKATESGISDIYKPKLPWFNIADGFLRNIVKKRDRQSNLTSLSAIDLPEPGENTQNSAVSHFLLGDCSQFVHVLQMPHETSSLQVSDQTAGQSLIKTASNPEPPTPKQTAKKRKLEKEYSQFDKAATAIRGLSSAAEEDEFDAFAKSIAMQMRQLPLADALHIQAEIQNILVTKRLEVLRRTP